LRARLFKFWRTRFLADNEWATKLSPVVQIAPAQRSGRGRESIGFLRVK
jgi:hypothetical protein